MVIRLIAAAYRSTKAIRPPPSEVSLPEHAMFKGPTELALLRLPWCRFPCARANQLEPIAVSAPPEADAGMSPTSRTSSTARQREPHFPVSDLRGLAMALNDRGIRIARGGRWHVSNVRNLIDRSNRQRL